MSVLPALALLPAIAVRRGRRPLQFAVVALVAHAGAFGTTTQRVRQATGPEIEMELMTVMSGDQSRAIF